MTTHPGPKPRTRGGSNYLIEGVFVLIFTASQLGVKPQPLSAQAQDISSPPTPPSQAQPMSWFTIQAEQILRFFMEHWAA